MRRGPHPLPIHIGMAAAQSEGIQKYVALNSHALSENDLIDIVAGIKKYQSCEHVIETHPLQSVWHADISSLLHFEGAGNSGAVGLEEGHNNSDRPPVLLVPSLVNRPNILNLCKKRSLMHYLFEQGLDTYLFDWGQTTHASDGYDINTAINSHLIGAINHIYETTGQPVNILGYCMGGTMSLAATIFAKDRVNKLVLMATPWDFQTSSSRLSLQVRQWAPIVLPVIEERGYLPAEWTQALFASIDLDGAARKFGKFHHMEDGSSKERLFIAVEDWLNDGIDLNGNIAKMCIREWFSKNAPYKGEWEINDHKIEIENIECPTLIVASKKDKLVNFESASAVAEKLETSNTELITLTCGHISLIAGKDAVNQVWKPVADWLKK